MSQKIRTSIKISIPVISFIWVGMVLGISFLEAPLKFQAPNITLELGLGIGQLVFTALNKVELVLAAIIFLCLLLGKFSFKKHRLYLISIGILLIQTFWLFPVLDDRIDAILSGQNIADSYHHITFVILEVAKVVVLGIAGIRFLKSHTISIK